MRPDVAGIATRAHELIAWADGYEEVNEQTARRVRAFARETLDLVDAYLAEASGRVAMQANYQRCLSIIETRVFATAPPVATTPVDDNPFPILT